MHHHRSFFISQSTIKNSTLITSFRHIDRTPIFSSYQAHSFLFPLFKLFFTIKMVVQQTCAIISKSFVDPNISPRSTGHHIAKPLMRQLMNNEIKSKFPHKTHRTMLHTSSSIPLRMTVLLISLFMSWRISG